MRRRGQLRMRGAQRACRRAAGTSGTSGQMCVEAAIVLPVVLVCALVIYNLMLFIDACAAFDRISQNAVVTQGVAPSGELSLAASVTAVEEAITSSLDRAGTCEVEVRAERIDESEGVTSSAFVISPFLTRFTCTLRFKPWPRLMRMPGITLEAPLYLVHERSLVVDRFRPGVVV